jgi:hypothetical protein
MSSVQAISRYDKKESTMVKSWLSLENSMQFADAFLLF